MTRSSPAPRASRFWVCFSVLIARSPDRPITRFLPAPCPLPHSSHLIPRSSHPYPGLIPPLSRTFSALIPPCPGPGARKTQNATVSRCANKLLGAKTAEPRMVILTEGPQSPQAEGSRTRRKAPSPILRPEYLLMGCLSSLLESGSDHPITGSPDHPIFHPLFLCYCVQDKSTCRPRSRCRHSLLSSSMAEHPAVNRRVVGSSPT
jgi:hypothetical protein